MGDQSPAADADLLNMSYDEFGTEEYRRFMQAMPVVKHRWEFWAIGLVMGLGVGLSLAWVFPL